MEKTLAHKYQIKTTRVGHSCGSFADGQILNRVVRATDRGYEMEVDSRHAELIIEQLGLGTAKGVSTPGLDDQDEVGEGKPEPLDAQAVS